jgi:hypothetical protein
MRRKSELELPLVVHSVQQTFTRGLLLETPSDRSGQSSQKRLQIGGRPHIDLLDADGDAIDTAFVEVEGIRSAPGSHSSSIRAGSSAASDRARSSDPCSKPARATGYASVPKRATPAVCR